VIRRPYQRNIFSEQDASVKYIVIATNRIESSEQVIKWYNQRGDCSENRIKELKAWKGCHAGNLRPMPSSLGLAY